MWWSILNGTIVNAATVAVGSGVGLLAGSRLPDRFQKIILVCLGLVTVILGVDAGALGMAEAVSRYGVDDQGLRVPTFGARAAMVVVGSIIVGAILGTALRLHARVEGLGQTIHRRFGGGESGAKFAEGFLSASVIFCVGPLTLLGCLNNGARGEPELLYIKAFLDGFCSMALAAALGAGVAASIATVLVFQGSLAVAVFYFAREIPPVSLALMNVVGGIVLLATALMILEIKRIPVADLLPGIFLPPVAVWLVERIAPGTLLLLSPR